MMEISPPGVSPANRLATYSTPDKGKEDRERNRREMAQKLFDGYFSP
jgi:hypothetical protein